MRGLLDAIIGACEQKSNSYTTPAWTLTRATNGLNGLVYRASSNLTIQRDLAVKISKRDERGRVGREFAALQAMWSLGIDDVSAYPLLIRHDDDRLPGDMLVTEWLEGTPLQEVPPEDDKATWTAILEALATVHLITPERARVKVSNAVFYVRQPVHLLDIIRERFNALPHERIGCLDYEQIAEIMRVAAKNVQKVWLQPPPIGLITGDVNYTNMILVDDGIRLVDWEYSGWSDPALDIADLLAKPESAYLSDAHKQWICDTHARMLDDLTFTRRVEVYTTLMHIFWVVKVTSIIANVDARKLEDANQGEDAKLIPLQKASYERCCAALGIG